MNKRKAIKVNINTASRGEIQLTPGIGKKKAEYFIQYRNQHSVFTKEALNLASMEELKSDVLDKYDFSLPTTAGMGA